LEELSFVFIQFNISLQDLQDKEKEEITDLVMKEYAELENQILSLQEEEELGNQLQKFMLQLIDANWIQHLEVMTIIKDGIHLR
ncbi:hypothetical protein OSK60_25560, partial [Escherichia coli]|nr:hypothetical protein [Escherichia coli]